MSNAGNVANLNATTIFTFKGQIVVVYVDGTTIEGEFITQDIYNIFLKTSTESIMIPRQQIRFIKGQVDQPVEQDTSQAAILSDAISTQPIPSNLVPESVFFSSDQTNDDDDTEDGTLILVTNQFPTPLDDDDGDDGTLIIAPGANQLIFPAETEQQEDEPFDMTVVIDEALDLPPEVATEPLVSDNGKGAIARLECIGGPHTGDSFTLTTGITTIGRSSDNTIALSGDKEVSRHHVIILFELGKYVVQDQNSLNGTFVNDQQITGPHYLENGDTFLTGLSTFKYVET